MLLIAFCLLLSFVPLPFTCFPSLVYWIAFSQLCFPSESSEEMSLDIQHPLSFLLSPPNCLFLQLVSWCSCPFQGSSSIHVQFFSLPKLSSPPTHAPSSYWNTNHPSIQSAHSSFDTYSLQSSLPTFQDINRHVHWLICRLPSSMVDFVQGDWGLCVSTQPLVQWDSRASETESYMTFTHATKLLLFRDWGQAQVIKDHHGPEGNHW